jgi:small-conductance mechanosensitive channel
MALFDNLKTALGEVHQIVTEAAQKAAANAKEQTKEHSNASEKASNPVVDAAEAAVAKSQEAAQHITNTVKESVKASSDAVKNLSDELKKDNNGDGALHRVSNIVKDAMGKLDEIFKNNGHHMSSHDEPVTFRHLKDALVSPTSRMLVDVVKTLMSYVVEIITHLSDLVTKMTYQIKNAKEAKAAHQVGAA